MSAEAQPITLQDLAAIIRRRKWQFVVPAVFVAVIGVLATFLIPPTYRSTATILIERQVIPTELVQSTVTSFADQRIEIISKRVMTTANLSELIERHNLYPDLRKTETMTAVVEEMRSRISVDMVSADVMDPRSGRPQEATIAFSVSFEDGSPQLAQKVTADLVSYFLRENLEDRTAAANETTTFLQEEAKRLGEQVNDLEARLATFKEEHGEALPEMMALNRELLVRTEERLRDNAQNLAALEQQAIYLESELAQLDPTLAGTVGAAANSPSVRLAELEAKYAQLKSHYTPEHPDRARLAQEISALRELVGETSVAALETKLSELKSELATLRQRRTDDDPSVASLRRTIATIQAQVEEARAQRATVSGWTAGADNPAYVQLRTRLEETRQKIASTREATEALQKDRQDYEARLTEAPKVEQQYRALTRDYDNAMSKYREVRDKVLQAEMAQSLEENRKGERFVVLEPPPLPEEPYSPNRPALLFISFVFSCAAGFGHLVLREALDNRVYDTRAVRAVTPVPVLGVIPVIETARERRAHTARRIALAASLVLLVVGAVAAVHFLVVPLDILWVDLQSRLAGAMPWVTVPAA